MPLNLYVSTKATSPQGALVLSKDNPIAQRMRDLVFGDVIPVNLYFVDGNGGYDAASGATGYRVAMGIGRQGNSPAPWFNTGWTQIANGWTGLLSVTKDAIKAYFSNGSSPIDAVLEISLTDTGGYRYCWAELPLIIHNRVIDDSSVAEQLASMSSGQYAIPNGVDSGTVTGLALPNAPKRVVPTVRKPSGGFNIFADAVDGSFTTDGFSFTLSAITDSGNYILDYVLVF